MPTALPLSQQLLTLSFMTTPTSTAGTEQFEGKTRQVLKITAEGSVSGDMAGHITTSIVEVHSIPAPAHQGIAITFTITTEAGSIDGFYAGSIHVAADQDKLTIHGYGKILSVTAAYADLFLAEVFVSSEVPRIEGLPQGENGRMTLSPC